MGDTHLPPISVVVITFNRFEKLKPTIEAFLAHVDYPRDRIELVITDDGSAPEVLERIRTLPHDKLVQSDGRKGLSANVNRGLAAARHDLVLQMEDDWEWCAGEAALRNAVLALQSQPDVGMVLLNQSPNDLSFTWIRSFICLLHRIP